MGNINCRNLCYHEVGQVDINKKFIIHAPQPQLLRLLQRDETGGNNSESPKQATPISIVIEKPKQQTAGVTPTQVPIIPNDIVNLVRNHYDKSFEMNKEQQPWRTIQNLCTFKVRTEKQGQVIVRFDNQTYYIGEISEKMSLTGTGILIQNDLSFYKGDFVNNKAHGQGQLHCNNLRAEGSWSQGDIQRGTIVSGDLEYLGELHDGIPSGRGYLKIGNSYFYDGEFFDGIYHGKGTQGDEKYIYRGNWLNGDKSGRGIVEYPDGSKFDGEWRKNMKDGKGQFTTANGDKWIGLWSYGEPDKGKWEFKD